VIAPLAGRSAVAKQQKLLMDHILHLHFFVLRLLSLSFPRKLNHYKLLSNGYDFHLMHIHNVFQRNFRSEPIPAYFNFLPLVILHRFFSTDGTSEVDTDMRYF
jgi:hypothetical protein